MTRLGVTGHQVIPEGIRSFVTRQLTREITRAASAGPLWGITSLAVGADQMFAGMVLRAGGRLYVVIPSVGYERTFDGQALTRYEDLLAAASKVERLVFEEPTEEAFLNAGRRVVDLSDTLLAVWDGKPSRGRGGTGDVVKYAQLLGRPVVVVWPPNVGR